ncbi:protein kinase [Streptomyces sp. ISL-98]|uniref:serine/threonine-protein kinase n=1 Tax=Streptomyces sp. ISL-98 TaxID=2819192 RepID=UPI001BE60429|nr:serine/threonine-protein kinase [Streptomyces sp. ISL-98]MBT2507563.1 protein kinase [Streptomyces sp. ISL-98]
MEKLGPADPQQIGAYRLLARLGAGGMGQVYLARSGRGRTVAVKLVRQELAEQEEFRARFRQEVAAARRVGGRWTAPVLDADTEAAIPWVATGYVAGPSLHSVVSPAAGGAGGSEASGGHGPLPERSVHILGAGLAHALRDIHAAGLIHRDLKPSNILVTIDGPRVIDFGIARALETVADAGLTRTGALIGSPGFMAPEQVRGERLTPACDIFCLGAVLAYAATGRLPFGTADSGVHALMYRIATEPPTLDGVPEGLQDLIRECLHKNPASRPSPDQIVARTRGGDGEPWLPGALVAQLGSHAMKLLEVENPDATEAANPTAQAGTAPRGDARAGGVPGGAGAGRAWPGGDAAGAASAGPAEAGAHGDGTGEAPGAPGGAAATPGLPGAEAFPPGGAGPGTAAPGAGESSAPGGAGAGAPSPGSATARGGTSAAPAPEGPRAEGSADGGPGAGVGGRGGGAAAAPVHPGAGAPAPRRTGSGTDAPPPGSAEAAPPGHRTGPPPAADGSAAATPWRAGAGARDPGRAGSGAGTPRAGSAAAGTPAASGGAPATPWQPHAGPPAPTGRGAGADTPPAGSATAGTPAADGGGAFAPGGAGAGVGMPAAGSPAGGMPPGARAGGVHAMPTVVSAAGPPPALARPQAPPPAPRGHYGYPVPPHYVYQSPSPEPPPRTTRSTVALIAVALVVALAAGGSVYAFMNSGGSDTDGRTDNRNGSPTPSSGGDESATPSADSSPTPEQGDGAVPTAYLGTWSGGLDSSEGYSTRRLTLQQGQVGDTVLSLTADGPMKGGGTYHCVFQAKLAAAPSGDAPLRIGPSKVVVGEPMTACTPGAASEVSLLPDGRLRRVNSTSGEALTYSKSE